LTSNVKSDRTLYKALGESVARNARRKALTYGSESLTYAEVGTRVERTARGLRSLGVAPGDKVAFLLPSCLDAPVVFFAPAAIGAVIVPVNPVYRQKEIQQILADSEASVVIAEPRHLGNDIKGILESIRSSLPHLKQIVWREPSEAGLLSLNNLPDDRRPLPKNPISPDELCALIYTSGTTGVPKAVMHSHSSMIAAVSSQQMAGEPRVLLAWHFFQLVRTHGRRFIRLATGPLNTLSLAPLHSLVGYGATLYGLLMGNHIVIADRFHPARLLELIEQHRINAFNLTPTMLAALLDSPDLKRRDLSSLLLLYVSTAPVPPDLVRRARAALKCPVLISFGMTEVGGGAIASSFSDPIDLQGETVGKLLPGILAKIVDDQNREVPGGQVGELALRMSSQMLGYYKAPDMTAASLDNDGWYYTGDLASKDAKGYFRIVGRKKDLIIRGGQNVFPIEIENHLLSKPGIQNVAVIGVPDPVVGERVWAYVLPQPGARLTPAQVIGYCRGELAPFKVPDQVRIVEDLPLATNGKVQKYLLRENARQGLPTTGR
jgi:fatty-acyl-CoA synthase